MATKTIKRPVKMVKMKMTSAGIASFSNVPSSYLIGYSSDDPPPLLPQSDAKDESWAFLAAMKDSGCVLVVDVIVPQVT